MGSLILNLTKSGIEHVQSHAVSLLRAGDCDKPFVVVVLRFVNLDHTAAHLAYFVDLLSTLADDGSHHVVGDIDLLRDGAASHGWLLHMLALRSAVRALGRSVASDVGLDVRSGSVCWLLAAVLHRHSGVSMSTMLRVPLLRVRRRRHVLLSSSVVLAVVVFATAVLT